MHAPALSGLSLAKPFAPSLKPGVVTFRVPISMDIIRLADGEEIAWDGIENGGQMTSVPAIYRDAYELFESQRSREPMGRKIRPLARPRTIGLCLGDELGREPCGDDPPR